jgi:EmrB/QacA subfamily drug resistance transporter
VIIWNVEPARPERVRAWRHAWTLAVTVVCFGAFMGQLDASIVTLTYRPMEHQFHASTAAVQWVSLSYLLTLVVLLPPIGNRSDRRGRKLAYLHGFALFSVASAACSLAPDLGVLIAARVVQGAGAALLQANSVALVTTSAPTGRLRSALGAQAAAQAVGLALGPTVGGLIVAGAGWRWVYAINVPVGAVALVAGVLLLPRTRTRRLEGRPDVPGSLLIGGASIALLLALSAAGGLKLPSPAVVVTVLLVASSVFFAAVVPHIRRRQNPVIDPDLLKVPGFRSGLLAALLGYLVLFGPLVLVPLVMTGQGAAPVKAGAVISSLPAGFALAAAVAGRALPPAWSDVRRSGIGAFVSVAVLVVMLFVPLTTSFLVACLAFLGAGLGMLSPSNNAAIMGSVPPEHTASGGGIISMTRALGTAIGIAAVTVSMHVSGPRLGIATLLAAAMLIVFAVRRSAPEAAIGASFNMPGHGRLRARTGYRTTIGPHRPGAAFPVLGPGGIPRTEDHS